MSRSKKKQPYRESRRFDPTCRNHGSCPYCADGRQHKHLRVNRYSDTDIEESIQEVATERNLLY